MGTSKNTLREKLYREHVTAKRYIPSWLFWLLRLQRNMTGMGVTLLRYIAGSVALAISFVLFIGALLLFLPSRVARIKTCNFYGHTFGHFFFWICGNRLTVKGAEHLDGKRPAIYISNHNSAIDIFLFMWKVPTGTCSVAKKEILFYPLFGQIYLLSGHPIVDRGDSKKAVASMNRFAEAMKRHRLSTIIWPEGTRSRDGHLKGFKKGFAHMALQTGLPVVPCVVSGTQESWQADGYRIRSTNVTLEVLPAIDTSSWKLETLDEHIAAVHAVFNDHLPPEQKAHEAVASGQLVVADWSQHTDETVERKVARR